MRQGTQEEVAKSAILQCGAAVGPGARVTVVASSLSRMEGVAATFLVTLKVTLPLLVVALASLA